MYVQIASTKNAATWDWSVCGYFDFDSLTFGAAGLTLFQHLFQDLKPRLMTRSAKPPLQDITLIHFDCHGIAQARDFMESHLVLGDSRLSFREIVEVASLSRTWLVFLNACETGLSMAVQDPAEEYYGLDGAFLAKGALNVISTLAPVPDAAACLLALRFYINVRFRQMDVAIAIRDAQLWLRKGCWKSDQELRALVDVLPLAAESLESTYLAERVRLSHTALESLLKNGSAEQYADPIIWAQWKCSGFGHNIPIPMETSFEPL